MLNDDCLAPTVQKTGILSSVSTNMKPLMGYYSAPAGLYIGSKQVRRNLKCPRGALPNCLCGKNNASLKT